MEDRRDIRVMIEEIAMTGDVIRENIERLKRTLDDKKELFGSKKWSKIYAVGCGDSLFAGQAAKFAFMRDTGIPFEAVEALEFCRYEIEYMPENALVFVMSYSGSVARTIECALIAQKRGATVIAITGKPKSRLAKEADNIVLFEIKSLGFAPGTISFTASLMVLYMCSVKLGAATNHINEVQEKDRYRELAEIADIADKTIKECDEPAKQIAEIYKDRVKYYFIGAGPNYPIAHFGAAKMIEGGEVDGIPQGTEEWAHEQYFVVAERDITIVIAPYGNSISRAQEVIKEMDFINTGNLLITTEKGSFINTKNKIVIPGDVWEGYSPLLTTIVLSLFSYYVSFSNGKSSYNFKSEEQEKEHYDTLHISRFSDELENIK